MSRYILLCSKGSIYNQLRVNFTYYTSNIFCLTFNEFYQYKVIYSSVFRATWTWLQITFFFRFRNSSTFLSTICCLLYNLSSTVIITNTTSGVTFTFWPRTPFTIDLKVYWDIKIRLRTKSFNNKVLIIHLNRKTLIWSFLPGQGFNLHFSTLFDNPVQFFPPYAAFCITSLFVFLNASPHVALQLPLDHVPHLQSTKMNTSNCNMYQT